MMMRRHRSFAIALSALAFAAAFSHTSAWTQTVPPTPEPARNNINLRLADGTLLRIACDKRGTSCTSGSNTEVAWLTTSQRRTPLKRGEKLFDARHPGVVGSIRG